MKRFRVGLTRGEKVAVLKALATQIATGPAVDAWIYWRLAKAVGRPRSGRRQRWQGRDIDEPRKMIEEIERMKEEVMRDGQMDTA